MFQSLEQRRLLSVTVAFESQSGVLDVIGSPAADQIHVLIVAGVNPSGPTTPGVFVSVWTENSVVHSQFYPVDTLHFVNLIGNGGDDMLRLSNTQTLVNTAIHGNAGADSIQAVNYGSAPGTEVFGGRENDIIEVAAGDESIHGHTVLGEEGDDIIYGSIRNDVLYGDDDGMRVVFIAPGNDLIFGGAGNDHLDGGGGNDALFGEEGDDFLIGGAGSDILNGGPGADVGVVDPFDEVFDVEKLVLVQ